MVKHLLQPWQKGDAWFWDTLVDADLANNAASWQWVAGSGVDAAPYFRIFNPVKQAETFDPNGAYVRKWCPELAKLPTPHIHAPWDAPLEILAKAGIELGRTYPLPIVDHKEARGRQSSRSCCPALLPERETACRPLGRRQKSSPRHYLK